MQETTAYFSEGLGYCNRYSPGLATVEEVGISEKIAEDVGATGGRPVSAGVFALACPVGNIKGRHTGLPLHYPLHRVGATTAALLQTIIDSVD